MVPIDRARPTSLRRCPQGRDRRRQQTFCRHVPQHVRRTECHRADRTRVCLELPCVRQNPGSPKPRVPIVREPSDGSAHIRPLQRLQGNVPYADRTSGDQIDLMSAFALSATDFRGLLQYDHRGANWHTRIWIDDILIQHADTSARNRFSNRIRFVRAMDAEISILAVSIQIEHMSTLGGKADMPFCAAHVCF